MFRHQAVNSRDSQFHNFEVCLFVVSTYVVDLSLFAFAHNEVNRLAMIFHIQPVTHVTSVAVDRQMFTFKDILDNQWNQFFREMIRAVVI